MAQPAEDEDQLDEDSAPNHQVVPYEVSHDFTMGTLNRRHQAPNHQVLAEAGHPSMERPFVAIEPLRMV